MAQHSSLENFQRHAREQAAYERKVTARAEKEQKTGKKAKGKQPIPPPDPLPRTSIASWVVNMSQRKMAAGGAEDFEDF